MTYREEQINPGMIKFDLPKQQSSIIKVIGVGGGGSNAVNHMFEQGIRGVDFIICNTDGQSLNLSPIPTKIQLGSSLTEGRGAGSMPEVGRNAAIENIEDIKAVLEDNTKMLFITAGMGGGTGTGAAPVIAAEARKMGILTVGIVTIPFSFEGRKRKQQAEQGLKELREQVDTLLVICNDKLRELYGNLALSEAFHKADDILTTAARGIAEIITVIGYINVDFEDVKTVMKNSGVAIMGSGSAEGEYRATKAVEEAMNSPLLNDNNIEGAKNILLYISSGHEEISMDEVTEITDFIQTKAGQDADIIWGNGRDETLGNRINITLVATGFEPNGPNGNKPEEPKKNIIGTISGSGLQPNVVTPPVVKEPENIVNEISLLRKNEVEISETALPEETITEPEAIIPEPEVPRSFVFEIQDILQTEMLSEETESLTEESKESPFAFEMPEMIMEPEKPVMAPEPVAETPKKDYFPVDRDTFDRNSGSRISKLKELSLNLKKPEEIDRLEREPAYKRREIELKEPRHSSESEVSSMSISENSKTGTELKTNNTFLHDNID